MPKSQLIEAPLSSGLSQKSDNRSAGPAEALALVNAVRQKNGAIRKRYGHTALARQTDATFNLSMLGGPTRTGSYYGRSWAVAGTPSSRVLWQYSDSANAWNHAGFTCEAQVGDRQAIWGQSVNPIDYDSVVCNGVMVSLVSAADPTGSPNRLYVMVQDVSGAQPTFTHLNPPSFMFIASSGFTSNFAPKLAACGTKVVATAITDSNTVHAASIDCTNPRAGWTAATTLTLSGGQGASLGSGVYDLAPIAGDATRFALCYEKSTTNSVSLAVYNVTGFAQTTLKNFETQANFNTIASMALVAQSNDRYWVLYVPKAGASIVAGAPVARLGFWNENGNTIGTPGTIFTWPASTTSVGKCGIDQNGVAASVTIVVSTGGLLATVAMQVGFCAVASASDVAGTATPVGSAATNLGVQLWSKPKFMAGMPYETSGEAVAYMLVYMPSAVQGTFMLVACEFWQSTLARNAVLRPVATLAPRLARAVGQPMAAGGSFTAPNLSLVGASYGSGSALSVPHTVCHQAFHAMVHTAFVDLRGSAVSLPATMGTMQFLSGGVPMMHDGQRTHEPNLLAYPEISAAATAGGSMGTGTYQYLTIYESYDAAGNLHQSATSPPVSVTVTNPGTGSVTLTISQCPFSYRYLENQGRTFTNLFGPRVPIYAVPYRTTAGGTVFYRVPADPPPGALLVDPTASAALSFVDTIADSTLTTASTVQLAYTTGGVLDNFNPPTARCIVEHKGRIFLAGCDEPTQVWPSQSLVSGIAPGWNEAIAFNATGAVRALASLDDKLIIFVQRGQEYGIEYVTGDGPTNLGTQSDWSPPQKIQADTGAVDQRAVCSTPLGVVFRGTKGGPNGTGGIFLLTRDLQAQYIGGPVEDTLAANPVVTSMTLHPNATRVYITCVQNDYVSPLVGVRLVWDYVMACWSMDTLSDADNAQTGVAGAASGAIVGTSSGPAYQWITATGRVYRETVGVGANSYTDAGTWVTMSYTSSWYKFNFSGAVKYWGVQLQSDKLDPADLTMTLNYDYASFPGPPTSTIHTWTAAAQAGFDRFPQVDVEMQPTVERAKSVQVMLSDAPPSGGPTATTGQGFSWASLTIEAAPEGEFMRYHRLSPIQRG